jgi:hypothetical protein
MSSTPDSAHQALDGDDDMDGGVDATAGQIMPTDDSSEFALTHTSSVCKKVYVDSGNNKTTLHVLSIGLLHDDQPLFSLEQEPWSSFAKNKLRPPKNSDLIQEIRLRASSLNMKPPRPNNWNQNLMIEWLEEYPVSDTADVQFLTF